MQLSIRDTDSIGSVACADGTSASPATIDPSAPLPAGTYYVAFSGQAAQQGAYEQVATVHPKAARSVTWSRRSSRRSPTQ